MNMQITETHTHLDRAIDKLYSKTPFTSDTERVALLFEKYQEMTQENDGEATE